ncbi:MAG: IS110 family transposase [Solirubrobacteraceae bacterium]
MIAVGVDSHKHRHEAVAIDTLGQLLGDLSIAADAAGYRELDAWAHALAGDGQTLVFGIEGAGSWGAGLCEHLQAQERLVLEVERPRRSDRRSGKSDRIDALAAAKRALTREGTATPRQQGIRRAMAALLNARRSAVSERTRVLNQLQSLHATAPVALRERIGEGTGKQLERRLRSMRARPGAPVDERAVFQVLRDLAGRARTLAADASSYEHELTDIVRELAPKILDEVGVGVISAAKLLVCDPTRFKSEAAFARCNGTAPLPASSGKTVRHRLSRGGDRQVNNAIHTIALSRSLHHAATRAYLERRISEGKTKREAMRALKRHLSRCLFKMLVEVPLTS